MFDLLIPPLIIGFVLYRLNILKKKHIQQTIQWIGKVVFRVYNYTQKEYKKGKVMPFRANNPTIMKTNNSLPSLPMKKTFSTVKWFVLIFIGLVLFLILNPFVNIDAGHRGIIFDKLRGGVQTETLSEGMHFRVPFFQSITQIPIRTQKIVFSNDSSGKYTRGQNVSQRSQLSAASSDLQDVYVDAVVTYHLDPIHVAKIYQEVGTDYAAKKVTPKVADSVKTYTAKYKVAEILTKREEIKNKVFADLQKNLEKDNIILEDINLVNFDFNKQFKAAIEQKQIEEQKAEKEKYILQQIEISSQQKVKKAEAEKQAKILEGEGIAEYNKSIQQEITANVLEYKRLENAKNAIEKWNGSYPQTYFGEGGKNSPIPLINLQK